jgi:AcrR family transcriptional regulator
MKQLFNTTRERILAAAEELFAETGVATTSLRTITSLARVNLAAVNYHFGSKEALIEAVYERRLGPLNKARSDNLDRLETAGRALNVEEIVEAFVAPIVELGRQGTEKEGLVFMRLLAQTYSEASQYFHKLFAREYESVLARYRAALERALPGLPADELDWRIQFMIGAVNHAVADTVYLRFVSGGEGPPDLGAVARHLVPFLAAGLRAPPAATRSTLPESP